MLRLKDPEPTSCGNPGIMDGCYMTGKQVRK